VPAPASAFKKGKHYRFLHLALATFLLEKKQGKKETFELVLSNEEASAVNLGGLQFKIATLIPYPVADEIQEKELKLAITYTGIDSW
jgi:hypothetical protein